MAANMTPIPASMLMDRVVTPPAPMSRLPAKKSAVVRVPPPSPMSLLPGVAAGVDPALAAQLVARGQSDKLKELTKVAARAKAKAALPTGNDFAKAVSPILPTSVTKGLAGFAKETVAAPIRAGISLGLSSPVLKSRVVGPPQENPPTPALMSRLPVAPTFMPKSAFLKELLGPEPIKSLRTRAQEAHVSGQTIGEKYGGGAGKLFGGVLGPVGVVGMTALDVNPTAGLEKHAAEEIASAAGKSALVKAFLKSGQGVELAAAREAKIAAEEAAREGMNLNSKIERGIKASPFYKKEKGVSDAMSTGWLLEKEGKQLVAPAEDVQMLTAKGWAPNTSIDQLAQEAGFDNPMSYLEAHIEGPPKVPTLKEMAAAEVDKGWRPAAETAAPAAAKLPRELAGAKPRYGYGSEQYQLTFASDIDKAAYIAANRAKTSGADEAYLSFVRDNTGWTDQQVFAHGNQVKAGIKDQVVSGKNLSGGIIDVSEVKPAISAAGQETALGGARAVAPGREASIAAAVPPTPPGLKSVPSVAAGGELERGFVTTVKEAPRTAPEIASKIQGEYRQVSNAETLAAGRKLATESHDEVISVLNNPKLAFTKDHAAAVMHLADQAQAAGRYAEATSLLEQAAKRATEAGQTGQAFAIWGRLTPTGALKYAQQLVEKAKTANPAFAKLSIPEATAKEITRLAEDASKLAEGSREKIVATAKLLDKTASVVPPSALRKISTLQTMAQLLNPKTVIRNLFGNAGFAVFENVSDLLGSAIDAPLSLVTGKRSLVSPSLVAQGKGLVRGWKLGLEDAVQGIDTMGHTAKYGEIMGRGKTFAGGILGKMETAMNVSLTGPDRAFYQSAFDGTIDNLLRIAKKTDLSQVPEKLATQMLETAHYEALRRTYQDSSNVAKLLMNVKKALNFGKEFGLGDVVIKYPKTPGNIISRGIEYSPIGFVDALFKLAAPLVGKARGLETVFDQRAFVQATSRALVGTAGLVGTGAALHKLGLISTKSTAPTTAAATEQAAGLRNYQINVSGLKRFVMSGLNPKEADLQKGDKLVSYDWMQPAAIGLAMGADIDKNGGKKAGVVGGLLDFFKSGQVLDALSASAETVAEQPAFTGLKRYLSVASTGNNGLDKLARNVMSDVPASFVPTFLNQLRQIFDRTERDSTNKNVIVEAGNKVMAKVPGLAAKVPERFDVFGKPINYYESKGAGRVFDVFVNPAFEQTWNPSPEAKLALDLWRQTGSTTGLPPKIDKSQQGWGDSWTIDAKDISAMQHYVGLQASKIMGTLAKNPVFSKLPVDKQQSIINSVFSDVTGEAKAPSYFRSQGIDVPTGTDPMKLSKLLEAASANKAWKKLPPDKRKLILERIVQAVSPIKP